MHELFFPTQELSVGEDILFDIAFAEAGLIRVRNMIELHAVCHAFLNFRPMKGPRLAVVTIAGGLGVMIADACVDYGLELAPLPEQIRKELENPKISWHRLNNPLDIWPLVMISGSVVEVLRRTILGLLQYNRIDAILGIALAPSSPLHKDWDIVTAIRDIQGTNSNHKPIALFFEGNKRVSQVQELAQITDVACFDGIDEAVMGLAATWQYKKCRDQKRLRKKFRGTRPSKSSKPMLLPVRGLVIGESAFALLQHYQIPLVQYHITKDVKTVVSFAREMGYPVVVKIISPEWLHKSDRGGVILNISTEDKLKTSFKKLEKLFQRQTPNGELTGILVQKQIQGIELLFGIKRDPQFGPVVTVGMGGIYTEVVRDVKQSFLPINREHAKSMFQSLRMYPILKGIRGQRGVHLPTCVDTLISLSRLAQDYPEINELDLNPVITNPEGCWCVDCRIVLG